MLKKTGNLISLPASRDFHLQRLRHSLAFIVLASVACHSAASYAQTISATPLERSQQLQEQQEQLQRARAEAAERERLLLAPRVELQTTDATSDALVLPTESPCFVLRQFVLEVPKQFPSALRALGASTLPQDPFRFAQDYLEQYAGACVGKDGMNLIVKHLAALIVSKGYSTTRVGIPQQDLSAGSLTLALVPGVVRAIRFANPELRGTWKNAFPTGPARLLNLHDIEQGLEQMKRVPSQEVDMEIVPGTLPGESDIVIIVKRSAPWKVTLSLDDSGAKGTGKLQAGMNASLDNVFGLNDLFNIGANTDADRKGKQRGTSGASAYYSLPYGYWTYSISAGSYDYHQQIAGLYQTFISSGKSRNLDLTAQKLLYRDQYQKHSWQFKVGKRWSRAYVDDTELNVQYRNTTFAELAWIFTRYIGEAQFNLTLANRWGVSWFNGQADIEPRTPDAPTYRYTLQTLDASLYVPFSMLGQSFNYIGAVRAQATRSALFQSEQFTIGNRYTVRGFDGEQSLAAERGVYVRNDIEMPLAKSGQALYIGLDAGRVFGPSVQYLLGDTMVGSTVGARGKLAGLRYDGFMSWAIVKPRKLKTAAPAIGFTVSYQY